ncbi:MAG: hypothetical protein Kow0098_20180 [Ignavibacteriaceae bacterium]
MRRNNGIYEPCVSYFSSDRESDYRKVRNKSFSLLEKNADYKPALIATARGVEMIISEVTGFLMEFRYIVLISVSALRILEIPDHSEVIQKNNIDLITCALSTGLIIRV